jgi:hypothetical protein
VLALRRVDGSVRQLEGRLHKHRNDVYKVAGIHSEKSQKDRETILRQFKAGHVPILVATDVIGRGLDVRHLRVIVQYDFPATLQQYVHRCGRTGRRHLPDGSSSADSHKQTAGSGKPTAVKKAADTNGDEKKGGGSGSSSAAAAGGQAHVPPPHPGFPVVPSVESGRGLAYSFVTRVRAGLAPHLITLLNASGAWIDPQLTALAANPSDANADGEADGEADGAADGEEGGGAAASAEDNGAAADTTDGDGDTAMAAADDDEPNGSADADAADDEDDDEDGAAYAGAGDSDDDEEDAAAAAQWRASSRAMPGSSIVLKPRSADDSDDE